MSSGLFCNGTKADAWSVESVAVPSFTPLSVHRQEISHADLSNSKYFLAGLMSRVDIVSSGSEMSPVEASLANSESSITVWVPRLSELKSSKVPPSHLLSSK
ncbi:hypothetical protein LIA77_05758 [Sarocladium implicatum]|nr:hypothetical protein LIA77_05758 [Sarocladium implicatum]